MGFDTALISQRLSTAQPGTTTPTRAPRTTQRDPNREPATPTPPRCLTKPATARNGKQGKADLIKALCLPGCTPPRAARDALAEFDRKPTRALATALICRDARWFTAQQARNLIAFTTPPRSEGAGFAPYAEIVARLTPDDALHLLRTTNRLWEVRALAEFALPFTDIVEAYYRVAGDGPVRNPNSATSQWLRGIALALFRRAATNGRAELEHLFKDRANDANPDALKLALAMRTFSGASDRQFDPAPAKLPSCSPAIAKVPEYALPHRARTTDPDDLTAITQRYLTLTEGDQQYRLALALLVNPDLRVSDRHRVLEHLTQDPSPAGERCPLVALDVTSAFAGDEHSLELWKNWYPAQVLSQHGWEPFGGIETSAEHLRRWHDTFPPIENLYLDLHFVEILDAVRYCGLSPEALRALHGPELQGLLRGSHTGAHLGDGTLRPLKDLIGAALGDSAEKWTAFHAIAPTFDGGFGELLDVCQAFES